MPPTSSTSPEEFIEKKPKKPRVTIACALCRKKRGRCDGKKPMCSSCVAAGVECTYDMGGDKRKPYTKSVVQALELRIHTLEAQLAAALASNSQSTNHRSSSSSDDAKLHSPLTASPSKVGISAMASGSGIGPHPLPRPAPGLDAFQGGLALNAHGELRFYGPTSSYRAVLSSIPHNLSPSASASAYPPSSPTSEAVEAIRAFSLTRAPIPTAAPAEPALPRRPPVLSKELEAQILRSAFENCFAQYNLVPERPFYYDFQMFPSERTQNYSPFLYNVIMAVGSRFLDARPVSEGGDNFPVEICGLIGDPETRGDVFITWARYLLDQEWYNPTLSTIRGLLVLGLYLAGRGFDGPSCLFVGLALRLTEDFGLHLGLHRLSVPPPPGGFSNDLISARRDTFFSALSSDIISSMYVGRGITFHPDVIDQAPPPVVPELDFDEPMYRSSAFHWSSKLIFIGSKIMTSVYSLKPNVSLAIRQAPVPDLHLQLERWYHELPSHLRASTTDPTKAPHGHILALNLVYNMMHIQLHRPFFRRRSADTTSNVSTEKCLAAAANIVRLVKLLKTSRGLRSAANGVQHAAFCCGTVLAISAVEDGISETAKQDGERRAQARKDLRLMVNALKEMGTTWTTAMTSAAVLEALMNQWDSEPVPQQPPVPVLHHLDPSFSMTSHQHVYDTSSTDDILTDSVAPPVGELDFKFEDHYPGDVAQGGPPQVGDWNMPMGVPFLFPSWDLDSTDVGMDYMSLLNPLPDSIVNSPESLPTMN